MLLNLHKKKWTDGLTLRRFDTHSKTNEQTVQVIEGLNLIVFWPVMLFCVYSCGKGHVVVQYQCKGFRYGPFCFCLHV